VCGRAWGRRRHGGRSDNWGGRGWMMLDCRASRQANMQCTLHALFCCLWDKPLMLLVSQDDSGEVASFILDPVLEELVEEDEG